MSLGWVKIHREILDSDIWTDVTAFRLFVYLILSATHTDGTKCGGITLKKGQFIRSYRKIAEDLAYREGRGLKQYSVSTIKRNIDKLVKSNRVSVSETEHGTLFTIINYAQYQDLKEFQELTGNASRNEVGTKSERSRNNNKNDKNDKNDNSNNNNVRKKYFYEPHHMKLAELLLKQIRVNNPNFKEPNLEAWANTFRLMMERDKREGKEIQDLIIWSQRHHFWHTNILSADKLRKQYDRLLIQKNSERRLTVVNGGIKRAESSFKTDYADYDFSAQGNVSWLQK